MVSRLQLRSPGSGGDGGIVVFVVAGLALFLHWSTFFCLVSPSAVVESVSRVLGQKKDTNKMIQVVLLGSTTDQTQAWASLSILVLLLCRRMSFQTTTTFVGVCVARRI